jgi:hypothetical protein
MLTKRTFIVTAAQGFTFAPNPTSPQFQSSEPSRAERDSIASSSPRSATAPGRAMRRTNTSALPMDKTSTLPKNWSHLPHPSPSIGIDPSTLGRVSMDTTYPSRNDPSGRNRGIEITCQGIGKPACRSHSRAR